MVLLTVPVIDSHLLDDSTTWLRKSYLVLDEMISRGNRIAAFRKSELEQLGSMLSDLSHDALGQVDQSATMPQIPLIPAFNGDDDALGDPDSNSNSGLMTAEIMAVAESIDTGDVDWIAHAVTENRIW